MNKLLQQLPILLPLAVEWAEQQEAHVLANGTPLPPRQISEAALVGVSHPEKIRLLKVDQMPLPANPMLAQAAKLTGLISANTAGLTFRYGIFVRSDCWGSRALILHECVHTAQYERLGGFEPFLAQYLKECLEVGYPEGALEQEAVRKTDQMCG